MEIILLLFIITIGIVVFKRRKYRDQEGLVEIVETVEKTTKSLKNRLFSTKEYPQREEESFPRPFCGYCG